MASTMQRMLIVDDERDICDCLEQFFRAKGFSVISAFSGEEALAQIEHGPVDVVLLDILLPGLSGIEVLKRLKARYPYVRVVMVTALEQHDLQEAAQRYGAAAYITKPFDLSESTWSSVLQ